MGKRGSVLIVVLVVAAIIILGGLWFWNYVYGSSADSAYPFRYPTTNDVEIQKNFIAQNGSGWNNAVYVPAHDGVDRSYIPAQKSVTIDRGFVEEISISIPTSTEWFNSNKDKILADAKTLILKNADLFGIASSSPLPDPTCEQNICYFYQPDLGDYPVTASMRVDLNYGGETRITGHFYPEAYIPPKSELKSLTAIRFGLLGKVYTYPAGPACNSQPCPTIMTIGTSVITPFDLLNIQIQKTELVPTNEGPEMRLMYVVTGIPYHSWVNVDAVTGQAFGLN
jgi:hypothetical protein